MRLNGHLSVLIDADGGMNEWGEPVQGEPVWSDPVPCHIKTNSDNLLGRYEDGVFHMATYQVLAEPMAAEGVLDKNVEIRRVRLSRRGYELGEYAVMSVERIEVQNRFEILV